MELSGRNVCSDDQPYLQCIAYISFENSRLLGVYLSPMEKNFDEDLEEYCTKYINWDRRLMGIVRLRCMQLERKFFKFL